MRLRGKKSWSCVLGAVGLFIVTAAQGHDPYEISSTASLYSNRTEVEIIMEFRTGFLLAGRSGALSTNEAAALFDSMRPELKQAAGRFFAVTAGNTEMSATDIKVALGVEDHIQFNLTFPAIDERPIRFVARTIAGLTNEGPYGATLTVLDTVNKKVLGQSVLFASSPAAEIGASPAQLADAEQQPVKLARAKLLTEPKVVEQTSVESASSRVQSPSAGKSGLVAALALLVAVGLLWAWNRSRRKERTL